MTVFEIKLAGIPVRVCALYESTKAFCKDYLTDEQPKFELCVTPEDITREQKFSAQSCVNEGRAVIDYPPDYLETLALYRKLADRLVEENVLLFHGSVVAVDGAAYLFTAKSGTGKTTHTRLWLSQFPDCHVLNGDKPLLAIRPDGIYACGTPWQGKENFGRNEILPLKAICILERGEKNEIAPISFANALAALSTQSYHPEDGLGLMRSMLLVKKLSSLKLFKLCCNMSPEAALVSYKAMTEETP